MPYDADIAEPRIAPPATVQWRSFLRALASEIDATLGAEARAALLRSTGSRMARLLPLPAVDSIDALALEMNDAIAVLGWGSVQLDLQPAERVLIVTHVGLPQLGSAGDPPGTWLAPLLEGLYETWMAMQPGATPGLTARPHQPPTAKKVTLRYGR